MGRFLLLLAVLLLGTAIFLLVILVQGADNEWAKLIFQTTLCTDGEELVQEMGSYVPRSGTNRYSGYQVAFYCENSDGEQRDVSLQTVGIMGAGFAVPFIASLILFFVAVGMMVSNSTKALTKNIFGMVSERTGGNAVVRQHGTHTVIDLRDGTYQGGQIPPEKLAQVQQIMDSLGLPNFFEGAGGSNTLTERLQQLEAARHEGLISEEEYQRLRQSILDDVGNG